MAFTEKLKINLNERSQEISSETKDGDEKPPIDGMDWLLLFMAAGYIDILFIVLAIIAFIPFVGFVAYSILDPVLNLAATFIFWFYLMSKGRGGYWWLAFGGGLAGLVPVVNWFSWIVSVMVFYGLVKAEKIPLAGEAIKVAAQAASKIK